MVLTEMMIAKNHNHYRIQNSCYMTISTPSLDRWMLH